MVQIISILYQIEEFYFWEWCAKCCHPFLDGVHASVPFTIWIKKQGWSGSVDTFL